MVLIGGTQHLKSKKHSKGGWKDKNSSKFQTKIVTLYCRWTKKLKSAWHTNGEKQAGSRDVRRSRMRSVRWLLTWCLNAGAAANWTLLSSAWPGDPAYSRILSSSCSRRPTSFSNVAMRASFVSKIAVSVPLEATPTFCVWYAFSNSICRAFRLSLVAFRSCLVESQTKKHVFHKKGFWLGVGIHRSI